MVRTRIPLEGGKAHKAWARSGGGREEGEPPPPQSKAATPPPPTALDLGALACIVATVMTHAGQTMVEQAAVTRVEAALTRRRQA